MTIFTLGFEPSLKSLSCKKNLASFKTGNLSTKQKKGLTDSLPKVTYLTCIFCGMRVGCSSEDQSSVSDSDNSTETSTDQSNDNDTGSGTSKSILTLDTSLSAYGSLASNGGSLALTKSEVGILTSGKHSVGLLLYRNSNGKVLAFDRACTHAGNQLNPFNSSGIAICSLHGSKFNTPGKEHSGPANSNPKTYETIVSGNLVSVKIE